jgi:hypothetical protein
MMKWSYYTIYIEFLVVPIGIIFLLAYIYMDWYRIVAWCTEKYTIFSPRVVVRFDQLAHFIFWASVIALIYIILFKRKSLMELFGVEYDK